MLELDNTLKSDTFQANSVARLWGCAHAHTDMWDRVSMNSMFLEPEANIHGICVLESGRVFYGVKRVGVDSESCLTRK